MEEFERQAGVDFRDNQKAMALSLAVGFCMLLGKSGAYWITGSAAIFSDAAESVVHLIAVSFAAFSLWLSHRPANARFNFGYERITFFSAGFEGAMIILAAAVITGKAVEDWVTGITLQDLGTGTLLVAVAGAINAGLGIYLVRIGKRTNSLILEANGKHVLTDSWTSLGVVAGLLLVLLTGWHSFDPICAIAVALNIVWSGARLLWRSIGGLLDYADPEVADELRGSLDKLTEKLGIRYHGLRFRWTGSRLKLEVHLLLPAQTSLGEAHRLATQLERSLPEMLGQPTDVVTHLEAVEDHSDVHPPGHHLGKG